MRERSFTKTFFHNSSGFTLIELMIVVAIVAILASIAIPSYYGYKYKAVRSEAQSNIGTIFSMEMAYATENSTYLTSAWTPGSIPGSQSIPWQTGNNFDSLGFSPKGKVNYRYSIGAGSTWVNTPSNGSVTESSGVNIIIQAEGDIDGDSATSQLYTTDETRNIITNNNY